MEKEKEIVLWPGKNGGLHRLETLEGYLEYANEDSSLAEEFWFVVLPLETSSKMAVRKD